MVCTTVLHLLLLCRLGREQEQLCQEEGEQEECEEFGQEEEETALREAEEEKEKQKVQEISFNSFWMDVWPGWREEQENRQWKYKSEKKKD